MKASDKSMNLVARDACNLESFHYPEKIISFTSRN